MGVCEELCPFLPGVQLGCSKAALGALGIVRLFIEGLIVAAWGTCTHRAHSPSPSKRLPDQVPSPTWCSPSLLWLRPWHL